MVVFGHFWANIGLNKVSNIQDGCTSSQDRPVDGCEKLITMTDVLKVLPWFTICIQFWITLYHHCDFFTEPTAKSHVVTGNSLVSSVCRLMRLKNLRR